MEQKEIFDKIVHIIKTSVEKGKDVDMQMDTVLVTELAMDSLDRVLLVSEIEDTFDIEIQTEEMGSIQTIGDIVESIDAKINQ